MPRRVTSPGRDLYALLGVAANASQDVIRASYRSLARTLHPDVCDATGAAERFAEIASAYKVLIDPAQRRVYDASRARPVIDLEDEPPEARDIYETFNSNRGAGFGTRRSRG